MATKKPMEVLDIFKIHIFCCFTLLSLLIIVSSSYIISGIVIISLNYDYNNYICIYDLLSVIIVILNVISYIIYYFNNYERFKIINILLLILNFVFIFIGVISMIYYNKINELSIICITGILIHIKSSLIFLSSI